MPAEQAEELDGFAADTAEPVRQAGVELGCFARCEHQILVAEDEPVVRQRCTRRCCSGS